MRVRLRDTLQVLERTARALENSLIVLLLSGLIAVASSQIVLRNVFSTTLAWGDELVRLMVLWLALIGAIAASRDARQIRIDVLSKLLPASLAWVPDGLAAGFTTVVCGALAWESLRFVQDSRVYEDVLLGNHPAWVFQVILPVGFSIMAWRYAVRTVAALLRRS